MEETDQQHKPLPLESQKDAVVEQASQEEADKQHRTFQPMFLESQEDIFVDEASIEKSKQCGAPIGKVRFGLIALVLAIAAVIAFCNNGSQPLSDIDLLANVVMPGVDISNLNETAPQYRALEWLAYNDTRGLTIDDNATELLERFSLVTFYYSNGGDSLRKHQYYSRWLKNSSHCDWNEFKCDDDGHVTSWIIALPWIGDLIEVHDTRTLPTEIGNLKRLRQLEVEEDSDMVGPIPSEIGHLQQLTYLDLYFNMFSGPIPSEIGHLQQLESLGLQFNELSGPIPSEIGQLQQLESLGFGENKLSGPIPSEIGHLQQLHDLGLEDNELSGPIPSEIGHLQQLHDLGLEDNELSGPIPSEIGHLQQLHLLRLGGNMFSGPIPSEILHLQQLHLLGLGGNMFSGPIPSEIGHLQQLTYLDLSSNKFSGPIPSEIGHLQHLGLLFLPGNIGLTGTVPVEVGQLESIGKAFFSKTSLTGGLDDPAFCKNLKSHKHFVLQADCGGLNPKITCECCTECCGIDENGRNPCVEF